MEEWILLELCFVDFFPLTHPIVIAKGPLLQMHLSTLA